MHQMFGSGYNQKVLEEQIIEKQTIEKWGGSRADRQKMEVGIPVYIPTPQNVSWLFSLGGSGVSPK